MTTPRTFYWVTQEDRRWRAVRQGRWKIVGYRDRPWELYDLEADPSESTDLASQQPETLERLVAAYLDEMSKDILPE